MSKIKKIQRVKLIISILSSRKELFDDLKLIMIRKFKSIDFESEFLSFNKTDYYEPEMSSNLLRKFYSFKKLIKPEKIAGIKIYTNKLELKFSYQNKRIVNIDPGYLTLGKLILATTKNQQHRIYLQKGIFAEVALRYREGNFIPWEWTYPDYTSLDYRKFFNEVREIYKKQIQ